MTTEPLNETLRRAAQDLVDIEAEWPSMSDNPIRTRRAQTLRQLADSLDHDGDIDSALFGAINALNYAASIHPDDAMDYRHAHDKALKTWQAIRANDEPAYVTVADRGVW